MENVPGSDDSFRLGNALRVDGEDARARFSAVLCDPNAFELLNQAKIGATVIGPFDHEYHGRDGQGVDTIQFNPDNTVSLVNKDTNTELDRGRILNVQQLEEARELGDALRVGNTPDVQQRVAALAADPDARFIFKDANFVATIHNDPFDVHGPDGLGVQTLSIKPDNSVDLIDKENNNSVVISNIASHLR